MVCVKCEDEFTLYPGKPGKANECPDCSEDPTIRYTGNQIYDHKTGCSIQINSDPALTAYIINSTKLRNKASNLGNNLKVSYSNKGSGRCLFTAGAKANAKGRAT